MENLDLKVALCQSNDSKIILNDTITELNEKISVLEKTIDKKVKSEENLENEIRSLEIVLKYMQGLKVNFDFEGFKRFLESRKFNLDFDNFIYNRDYRYGFNSAIDEVLTLSVNTLQNKDVDYSNDRK
jgi:hypothetical protein